ncbi:YVH1 [Candida oxycetoniae]|uniref:protein-tyrosine-phosphatase n=1 Tax=Candida oxycetoniae TaxID=497107 RepID=A0AAI9SVE6_9ASCO|nr:YVH1 [Candida oxycetoniae]KAI3403786.2 YVH1 [Candida oxycetoniae]
MSVTRILGGIYLSSISPLNAEVDFKSEFGITAILSVVPGHIKEIYTTNYKWKQIDVTDEETTNLLPYFNECFHFIEETVGSNNGKVLVHCSQGVSRSVAVVVAYLMKKHKLNLEQALYAVKRKVPDAEPNRAFIQQLELYQAMKYQIDPLNRDYKSYIATISLKNDPSGQLLRETIMNKRFVSTKQTSTSFDLRCRKCRQVLANNTHIEKHDIPEADSRQSQFIKTAPNSRRIISVQKASACSHHFFAEPVDWMRDELEKAELEGKFQCPKCSSKMQN